MEQQAKKNISIETLSLAILLAGIAVGFSLISSQSLIFPNQHRPESGHSRQALVEKTLPIPAGGQKQPPLVSEHAAATGSPLSNKSVPGEWHVVSRVVDGDTIRVVGERGTETVRLIGINAPETIDTRRPHQCFGKESSAKTKEFLTGKRIRLEADPTQEATDHYGRTLAYVFLQNGTNVNEYLIRQGYAREYTYRHAYRYQSAFKKAEQSAKNNEQGLWAPAACGNKDAL